MIPNEELKALREKNLQYIKTKLDEKGSFSIDVFANSDNSQPIVVFKKYEDYWVDEWGSLYELDDYNVEMICDIATRIHLLPINNIK